MSVGDLFADLVVINGSLQGEVKGRSVSLGKTACVVGDILHQFIAIEKGAELEGHCRRTEHLEDDREVVKNKKSSTVSLVIRGKKIPDLQVIGVISDFGDSFCKEILVYIST